MSKLLEEQHSVRVRRQSYLPAHFEDYELSGFHQRSHRSQAHPATVHQNEEDTVEHEGAVGGERSVSPISQDNCLSSQWVIKEQWPLKGEFENSDKREEHVEKGALLKELKELRQQNDRLRYQNEHSQLKLEKLTHQSSMDTHQLRKQVEHLGVLVQQLQVSSPPVQPTSAMTELQLSVKPKHSSPLKDPSLSHSSHAGHQTTRESSETSHHSSSESDPDEYHYRSGSHRHSPRAHEYDAFKRQEKHTRHCHSRHQTPSPIGGREQFYRGPAPTIPAMIHPNPREFNRLKIALDNLLPHDASEMFKYQILVDHLKSEEALLIADSYSNSRFPFTDTMAALNQQYGQPHQLALQRIAELMDGPNVVSGDTKAFRMFALRVRSLVSMLEQLGGKGKIELECGSHVSRLLGKLPHDLRSSFRRFIHPLRVPIPTLLDLADWLEYELQVQEDNLRFIVSSKRDKEIKPKKPIRTFSTRGPSAVLMSTTAQKELAPPLTSEETGKRYCPFCDNNKHSLNNCANFKMLSTTQKHIWTKTNNRCWRCGRGHRAAECNLKMRCKTCSSRHLLALHDINHRAGNATDQVTTKPEHNEVHSNCTTEEVLYIDRPLEQRKVLLKVSKVVLRNGDRTMDGYAILDDGSERTILLHPAAEQLGLKGEPEDLPLRTVRQELQMLHGAMVSFTISPAAEPNRVFNINRAFTAKRLGLAEHTHPVEALQKKYWHLRDLPLQSLHCVRPVLLIGSDHPHLITPIEPVRLGPPGGPAAVKTRLGWTLQGPAQGLRYRLSEQQCLFTSTLSPSADIYNHVEKLWQMDILPWRSEKACTRSRQDKEALALLEQRTVRKEIEGTQRYATPLLRVQQMPQLKAPKDAVLPQLRATEKRWVKDPEKAAAYRVEIQKLINAGYVQKLEPGDEDTPTSWYIPHHMVTHNGKNRVVFNCSFEFRGENLNKLLLPGPILGPSLLAVLLRFREHAVAVSSDIRSMFHQVRLLPEDQPLLRFLWRDGKREEPPSIYEWRVLPFGTTCSPCCAIFALQKHIIEHSREGEDIRQAVLQSFYVDNCLRSLTSENEARVLVDKLQDILGSGGFELRQWASNKISVISHLPPEIRSDSAELVINKGQEDASEPALGLRWHCSSDTLTYNHHSVTHSTVTLRTIYQVLASQYDPLGFIVPYTTRAKVIVQRLWDKKRDWDDPSLPEGLLHMWQEWESELSSLKNIVLPRCYTSEEMDSDTNHREIHIFCDASERAYGSVAYIRTKNTEGKVETAFLTARSRVAPKRQQSIPRLELCAALTGAQLANVLKKELTLLIHQIILWTDSTTVLTWLSSESCRFKVFVGTRVAEIQDLTDREAWRYVDSANNPADDITRGKHLQELTADSRWFQGPAFLKHSSDKWPQLHQIPSISADCEEVKKTAFCGLIAALPAVPDIEQLETWPQVVAAIAQCLHGAANTPPTADNYREAENSLLQRVQQECFPDDYQRLMMGKSISSSSRIITLAPEFDNVAHLIRVGGRLRHTTAIEEETLPPIILDPKHKITQLLIQHCDDQLHHPGCERVFAELRRKYWILRGREAVRRHQHHCTECRKWRGNPKQPRMADLPPARLRLHKPAFYSTGVDCFGPYHIKIGRRTEKRWGIIFKCMTTRAVHLDLLPSIDADSFLMSLRRFVARRGKPFELLSDQGTNFRGGERELQEAFSSLHPDLQVQLASQQIKFTFNPPSAPHFGGCWEREIRSLKQALQVTIGTQSVTEEVLQTVLVEIEGILNSKPLGYTSSDVADPDPITPNILLMGRLDASLPQVVYPESEILSRRRWRHSQLLADQFWRSFIRFYLPGLQTRQKWCSESANLQAGDVVMIIDPQLPRASWPIGQIIQTFPASDGRVRTVEGKVGDRSYTRPVSRIISLPKLPDC
ncbi:uncharacterized protein LOC113164689 [Anabas testudineus]|uniref:uncharacterized protein LOC113164689 n=1 Tax=Anabas testudineus TaxID=64144 RepID=UPI000E455FD7|nr:uncharacterized protein LOC113164689 [Anabas testudineus]